MLTRCLHDSIAVATAALWGLVGCSSPSPERRQITHQQWFKSCADIGLLSGSITGLCADDDYVYVAGSYTSSRGGIAALSAQSGKIVWQRLGIGLPNLSTPTRIIDRYCSLILRTTCTVFPARTVTCAGIKVCTDAQVARSTNSPR